MIKLSTCAIATSLFQIPTHTCYVEFSNDKFRSYSCTNILHLFLLNGVRSFICDVVENILRFYNTIQMFPHLKHNIRHSMRPQTDSGRQTDRPMRFLVGGNTGSLSQATSVQKASKVRIKHSCQVFVEVKDTHTDQLKQ